LSPFGRLSSTRGEHIDPVLYLELAAGAFETNWANPKPVRLAPQS
jgi:hypothetical protein